MVCSPESTAYITCKMPLSIISFPFASASLWTSLIVEKKKTASLDGVEACF